MAGIKQVESGGNMNARGGTGENGGFQFMPSTWTQWAGKYLGDPNANVNDPANQNKVAYARIADLKAQGMNPSQIASMWNSGKADPTGNVGTNSASVSYDTPTYVQNVLAAAQQAAQARRQQSGGIPGVDTAQASTGMTPSAQPVPQTDQPNAQGYYDMSKASASGFVGNAAGSVGGILGGLGQAIMHPIQTAQNLLGMGAGGVEKLFGANNQDTQLFDGAVGYLKNKYGGDSLSQVINHVGHSLYTDPASVALDLSTLLDGVGAAVGAVGKVADISRAADLARASDYISTAKGLVAGSSPEATAALTTPGTLSNIGSSLKTAGQYTNPLTPLTKGVGMVAGGVTSAVRTLSSKMIGLSDPASMTAILSDPAQYSKMAMEQVNRGSVADEFASSLDALEQAKTDAGRAYNPIKAGGGTVSVPENWLSDILSKGTSADESGKAIPFKLSLEKQADGSLKVVSGTASNIYAPGDLAAIQNFVDRWGNKTTMTPEEFLNMRQQATKMGKFGRELGINDGAALVGKAIRADANKVMRPQISGLQQLDTTSAPLIKQYQEAKKTFLTTDGQDFKPGAINKITNAIGKGKNELLATMEKISPGITKKLQILKTVEDIQSTYGIKTATYMKDIITGGGIMTGNVPMIIASLISHPAIAIPLLRGAGYTAKTVQPIINVLKMIAGDPQLLKYYAVAGQTSLGATNNSKKQ